MELQDMYSIELLDFIIGMAIEKDKMDIKGFNHCFSITTMASLNLMPHKAMRSQIQLH